MLFGLLLSAVAARPSLQGGGLPPRAAAASISIPCGDAFDERLAWLLSLKNADDREPLLRVEEIGPADAPRFARVGGSGISLWISRDAPAAPITLRLASQVVSETSPAPSGCVMHVVPDACDGHPRELPLPLDLPAISPRLFVSRPMDGEWGTGRAGMLYRDLLPDRAGGAVIVSHIQIPTGGPVPDYVHFHRVAFQLIYVLKGWVDVVYEGQGPPFRMHANDFVTQPPTIRHRVLRSSDGLEVLEIGLPAEHATIADHSFVLPDAVSEDEAGKGRAGSEGLAQQGEMEEMAEDEQGETLFGGQTFVRHINPPRGDGGSGGVDRAAPPVVEEEGIEWTESAVLRATRGLARVRTGRCVSAGRASAQQRRLLRAHTDAFALAFVLGGDAVLEVAPDDGDGEAAGGEVAGGGTERFALSRDACFCVPPGRKTRLVEVSDGFALLEVRLSNPEELAPPSVK